MTTAAQTQTISAAAFLFGDNEDSVKALAGALKEEGVVGAATGGLSTLSRTALNAVGAHIASVAHELVDIDFAEVISEGWRKMGALNAAAKRTRDESGSSEVVDLASHSIASTHTPRVELQIDGAPVATVKFELSLKFTLKAVVATVSRGRLTELHSGTCDIEGLLKAEGKQLAKRSGHYELPLLIRLGKGIPLLIDDGLGVAGETAPGATAAADTGAPAGTFAVAAAAQADEAATEAAAAAETVTVAGATITAAPVTAAPAAAASAGIEPAGAAAATAPAVEVTPIDRAKPATPLPPDLPE